MGVASDIEPRTSMERHLMDRDREGQLYLEARRQQAAVDLLKNRSSFLSTITPPSSNPSSAASSLYHEPTTGASTSSSLHSSSQQLQPQQPISTVPNTPMSPLTNMSPAVAATMHTQSQSQSQSQAHLGRPQEQRQGQGQAGASALAISSSTPYPYTTPPTSSRVTTNNNTTTVVLSLASPPQHTVPIINKKTRKRSATTGPGRGRGERSDNFKGISDRPVLPISPSSLEYQLTANLLNYPPPSSIQTAAAANTSSSSSTAQSRPRSRSRSKSRPQQPLQQPQPPLPAVTTITKARRHTVNKDARIDTTSFGPSSRGTGHRHQQQNRHNHHKHNDSNGSNDTTTSTTTSNSSNNNTNNRYNNGNSVQLMTPQEWTPISFLGSYPPSPTAACALGPSSTSDNPYFIAASATALTTTPITTAEPKFVSVPLPPIPPSPPLPPLPPKSPKTLIAQYFPRSLAPPPSRVRTPYGQRELIVSPTPFKTPTFGPALISPTFASTTTHPDAPSLPSPSASFQYIPTADISRVSTSHALQSSQHHQHLFTESDFSLSSNRPSPNVSVIGFQGSTAPTPPPPRMMPHQQHPARLPSDLDLILYNSRQRPAQLACSNSTFNKQGASSVSSNEGLGPVNTAQDEVVTSGSVVIPTAPALLFAPLRPHSPAASAGGIRATPSTTSLSNPPISPSPTILPTTPIYPRGLSFPSILGDNAQVIIRLHQKPVPYIRELVPGKETELAPTTTIPTAEAATGATRGPSSTVTFVTTSPSQPASTNTSRDLEMILDEITGRLRTNRTSMDPWAYNLSSWDDKPLPPVRRERGSRYWVFRDQGGLVLGPILFLVGHLFPPLWWVGALYPRLEHPDTVAALEAELARAAEMEAYSAACVAAVAGTGGAQVQETEEEENDARDRQNGVALQWLQRQLKTLGVTVASITLSSSSSKSQPGSSDGGNPTIATLQMVQVGTSDNDDNEREGSTLANISTIHVPYQPPLPAPMPPSILDSRGPWAARGESSRASSLFEQRMAHDRKVLRHELDLRWRRINLLWSIASLLLAICLVVIVLGVRK